MSCCSIRAKLRDGTSSGLGGMTRAAHIELEPSRRLHRQETERFRASRDHPREEKGISQWDMTAGTSSRRGCGEMLSPRAGRGCSSSLLLQAAGSSVLPLHSEGGQGNQNDPPASPNTYAQIHPHTPLVSRPQPLLSTL